MSRRILHLKFAQLTECALYISSIISVIGIMVTLPAWLMQLNLVIQVMLLDLTAVVLFTDKRISWSSWVVLIGILGASISSLVPGLPDNVFIPLRIMMIVVSVYALRSTSPSTEVE